MLNLKNEIVTDPKLWENSKSQVVTKLKMWQNSNCDKPQKLKLWQHLRTQIARRRKISKTQIVTKLKFNWWQHSRLKFWQLNFWQNLNSLLVRTTWHLDNQWDVLWAALAISRCLFLKQCSSVRYQLRTDRKYEYFLPGSSEIISLAKSLWLWGLPDSQTVGSFTVTFYK